MAKHKHIPKREPAQPLPAPGQPASPLPWWERPYLAAAILAGLVFLVYAASVGNGFVFFDDDKAILYNQTLKQPSLQKFFSGQNLGMYAPLSWIGYWLGSLISGTEAWGYHLLSMLLHGANTVLAYFFLRHLLGRHWPAFFAAALFAVHPVQVEAVSWAAALSTVLFSCFYLLSLLAYLAWKRRPAPGYFGLALAAFLCAGLSKSAAVTLPLALIAIDVYQSRRWDWAALLNKVPFFAFSLFLGAYTLVTRAQEGHDIEAASRVFTAADRFWMVGQTLLFYPVKLLAPVGFSVSYPFVKTGGVWPWTYYAAPAMLLALALLLWKKARGQFDILFAVALYVIPLAVMLPFRTVGSFELRSDRYVYLSSLGLFLLAALFLERQRPVLRNSLLAGAVALAGFLAYRQTAVWKDGIALFTNCVKKTPQAALCQCNLAYSELLALKFENAVYHYTEALRYDPATVEAYNGRGQAYFRMKKIPEALDDFTRAIQAGLVTPKLFLNRGKCLVMLGRPEEALPDLGRSLELEPRSPEAYFFRAAAYEKTGNPGGALEDYSKAIEQNPDYLEALVNRALIRMNARQLEAAIDDYSQAIRINPNLEMLFNNRGYAHLKNGQPGKALDDVNKAIGLNARYARAYQTRAVICQQTGQMAQAQADMQMAQQLQQGQ
ncbi:MAG: tetratricopeptide repeat protein [Saprospirales bacterium]|nr:tetratricopeptide repeat protein [Saprospirales bacterium]